MLKPDDQRELCLLQKSVESDRRFLDRLAEDLKRSEQLVKKAREAVADSYSLLRRVRQ